MSTTSILRNVSAVTLLLAAGAASASTGAAFSGMEPSTWAMLIVGFGFVGSTMRNRRTARRTA